MNRRAPFAAVVALGAAMALAGCSGGSGPELQVSGAFMPQPVGDMAAGFLTVENGGGSADKLTSVTSTVSDDVTIHVTEDQRMREVKSFDIPAGGALDLERGGNHIMFTALKSQPRQGEKVSIELHFEESDPIEVDLPVKEPAHNPQKH